MNALDPVARAALDWFQASPTTQRRLPARQQWTVLAAFVLKGKSSDECRVLAAATGNKCVGRRELDADGLVVLDCHAEVLARRALLRYLYCEAASARVNGGETPPSSAFEWDADASRLGLREQFQLHLYISEPPCGDAAIYPLREDVVDALVSQRAEREQANNSVERSALRLTGAKTRAADPSDAQPTAKRARTEEASAETHEHKFAQVVGVARVKSGRSDLPEDKRTLSMSCSDKLAKWHAVGVQGTLLLRFFKPLRLASIVVSQDPRAASADAQLNAMCRAIVDRVEAVKCSLHPPCSCAVVSSTFDRSKPVESSASLQPSPLALNWTCREPHWSKVGNEAEMLTQEVDSRWASKFFQAADVEVLMGATGLKQGAKKATKLDFVGLDRVASRLAKRNLFRAFCYVDQLLRSQLPSKECSVRVDDATSPPRDANQHKYQQVKEAILSTQALSGKAQLHKEWTEYLERRERFSTDFVGWVGVPVEFKSFSLVGTLEDKAVATIATDAIS